MTPTKIRPHLFTLPLELRQQIYSHLLPAQPTSHPLPSVGLTSVSHRPPTSALLNIHPQIGDEILEHFYTITTWKLIFSHAFNFFRADPHLQILEQSPALHSIRKVEIVFFCDILLLKNYPSFGLRNFCAEIRRRAERACEVLAQARSLRLRRPLANRSLQQSFPCQSCPFSDWMHSLTATLNRFVAFAMNKNWKTSRLPLQRCENQVG